MSSFTVSQGEKVRSNPLKFDLENGTKGGKSQTEWDYVCSYKSMGTLTNQVLHAQVSNSLLQGARFLCPSHIHECISESILWIFHLTTSWGDTTRALV